MYSFSPVLLGWDLNLNMNTIIKPQDKRMHHMHQVLPSLKYGGMQYIHLASVCHISISIATCQTLMPSLGRTTFPFHLIIKTKKRVLFVFFALSTAFGRFATWPP